MKLQKKFARSQKFKNKNNRDYYQRQNVNY